MDFEKIVNPIVKDIPPSGIRKFFDLANQMEGVISLGVGEPDFATPWTIREAAIYSLKKEKHSILLTRIIRIKKRNL